MKVLIFSKPYWPSVGGVEVTTRMLAQALSLSGMSVTVSTDTCLGDLSELQEGYEIWRNPSFCDLMRMAADSLVVISKGGVSVPVCIAAMLTRRPLIIWHEMAGDYRNRRRGLKHTLTDWLRVLSFNYAVAHVGVTSACLNSKPIPKKRIKETIYNSVNPEMGSLAKSLINFNQKEFDVLYVGRLVEAKGIFVLGEALNLLSKLKVGLKACFVGKGPDESQLRQCLKGVESQVFFGGQMTGQQLADFYARSRILVLPSTSHPEGMGMVIAEAFSFGLPVVGAEQLAIREVVGDSGVIVPIGDSQSLAYELNNLLSDSAYYKALVEKAFLRASLFEFDTFREKAVRLVKEVAANKKGGF